MRDCQTSEFYQISGRIYPVFEIRPVPNARRIFDSSPAHPLTSTPCVQVQMNYQSATAPSSTPSSGRPASPRVPVSLSLLPVPIASCTAHNTPYRLRRTAAHRHRAAHGRDPGHGEALPAAQELEPRHGARRRPGIRTLHRQARAPARREARGAAAQGGPGRHRELVQLLLVRFPFCGFEQNLTVTREIATTS